MQRCVRDEAVSALATRLSSRRIAKLLLEDVATVDPRTKYVEAKRVVRSRAQLPVLKSDRTVPIDEPTAEVLENYLNAQPPGRPYNDYRPETSGPYLFPSRKAVRRGRPVSHWSVNRILRVCKMTRCHPKKGTRDALATPAPEGTDRPG